MKNISFMLTVDQIRDRSKDVTRRLGWAKLKPGDLLQGVVKGMGLKRGETIQKLAVIRVVSVRRERLDRMTTDADYGFRETEREGFAYTPQWWPSEFIRMFCASHKGCPQRR